MTFPPPEPSEGRDGAPSRLRRLANRWGRLGPFAIGLIGAVVGLLLFTALQSDPEPLVAPDIEAAVVSAMESQADAPARSAEVFTTILPSLVYIRTEGNEASADGRGVGSGVIINADGSILTAYHVVAGARTIAVTFADGTEATAEVVSAEPDQDLAVLLANGAPAVIVPAVLGGSGVRIGDETFAVGNPLGLVASFSAGVISGFDRTIPLRPGNRVLGGLIQFDAAVNPGSSGGPLLNRDGQVIGIVTALANPSREDSFTGIGFAIPIGAAGGGGAGPPR